MRINKKLIPVVGLATIATTIPMTACHQQRKYIAEEDLSPGKTYVPTIQPTTQIFTHGTAEDNKKATNAYFQNGSAPTIIKEDVCGYLKPYIDSLGDLTEAREWLRENLPIISEILERILSDYGLDGLGDMTKTIVNISQPAIAATQQTSDAVAPYKLSSNIVISAKAELMDKDAEQKLVKWGDIDVTVKITLKDVPYTVYYSNSGKWMCGNGNNELGRVTGWTLGYAIDGNIIKLNGEVLPLPDPKSNSWTTVPDEGTEERTEFDTVRKYLQWDSTYLSNSNE